MFHSLLLFKSQKTPQVITETLTFEKGLKQKQEDLEFLQQEKEKELQALQERQEKLLQVGVLMAALHPHLISWYSHRHHHSLTLKRNVFAEYSPPLPPYFEKSNFPFAMFSQEFGRRVMSPSPCFAGDSLAVEDLASGHPSFWNNASF